MDSNQFVFLGSSDFPMGLLNRIQVQNAAVEIDGDLTMVTISESIGTFLYRGNLGIPPFRHGIGDAMREVGQHIRPVPGNQLGRLDHGRQAAVGRPVIPALPEAFGPARTTIPPQGTQRFFQRPRAPRLQVFPLDPVKSLPRRFGHIPGGIQPEVLASRQSVIALCDQRRVFLFADPLNPTTNMLHDVEAVKHHFVVCPRHMGSAGVDEGGPHVQADRLNPGAAVRPQGIEIGGQAFFFALGPNVFNRVVSPVSK